MLAADLDNDGYDDLVAAAPGEDVGPEGSEFVDGGAIYVVRGGSGGLDLLNAADWTELSLVSQTAIADGDSSARYSSPTQRRSSPKRGSSWSGSNAGSTFRFTSAAARSSQARSSHSKAGAVSPNPR